MNFFEAQEQAKRNTGRLVLLFVLGVLGLVAVISLFSIIALQFGRMQYQGAVPEISRNFDLVLQIATGVILMVVLGSLYKLAQLRAGGRFVAERLGGRLLDPGSRDPEARKVLNIVEEMAIASGIPVPPVYVLEEQGINAFAAGTSPRDAVIGVTQGTIRLLSRDELQGVIAHEFSHIFHGDMSLNMRLIGVLHGLLLLSLTGSLLLRTMGRGRSRDKAQAALVLIGFVLVVCGYAGVFFGDLIRAAISRQREFLADAAAVQFTRNPDGIAGALKKIGGNASGSDLAAEHAAEFSHMYFDHRAQSGLTRFLATHPPLEERIRRLDPRWDGQYIQPEPLPDTGFSSSQDWGSGAFQSSEPVGETQPNPLPPSLMQKAVSVQSILVAIDDPAEIQLATAQEALQQIPAPLLQAARSQQNAPALMYGLIATVLALDSEIIPSSGLAFPVAPPLSPALYLPLIDLSLPTLKALPREAQKEVLSDLEHLFGLRAADHPQAELLAWAYIRILESHLGKADTRPPRYQLTDLPAAAACLLGMLARYGHDNPESALAAFYTATHQFSIPVQYPPTTQSGIPQLNAAMQDLVQLWPLQKPLLLKAMASCIAHDGLMTETEAGLIRAIADMLDCPIPLISISTMGQTP